MKGAPEYPLVEVFESLQGEGRNSGRSCVFIRFAGCNLDCPWCDTPRERRFSATLDELVAEAKGFRARSVVLTGGEPAVQEGMPELVAALKREGFWIAVETNGTKSPDWFAFVDYVACSPKAEYAALYDARALRGGRGAGRRLGSRHRGVLPRGQGEDRRDRLLRFALRPRRRD